MQLSAINIPLTIFNELNPSQVGEQWTGDFAYFPAEIAYAVGLCQGEICLSLLDLFQ